MPQVPPGLYVLADVHSPTTCVAFSKAWKVHVVTAGSADTVTYTWAPNDAAGITLFVVDSAAYVSGGTAAQRDSSSQALWPYDGAAPFTVGSTPKFVPGSSLGWSVTFPSKLQGGLNAPALAEAAACSP